MRSGPVISFISANAARGTIWPARLRVFNSLDVLRVGSEFGVGLRHHPIGPAQEIEIVDVKRSEDKPAATGRRHSTGCSWISLWSGQHPRKAGARGTKPGEDASELGILVRRGDEAIGHGLKFLWRMVSAQVLHLHLESTCRSDPADRRRRDHQREPFLNLAGIRPAAFSRSRRPTCSG